MAENFFRDVYRLMLRKLTYRTGSPWAAGLVVLVAIVLLTLPLAIEWAIERGLTALGAQQVSIEDVDFNPFVGRLRVKGLQAQAGDAAPLKLDEASLRIAWWPLWRKHIVLDELTVRGLQLPLEQRADGQLLVAGMPLPAGQQDAGQEPADKPPSGQVWGLGLRWLQLEGSDVRYRSPELEVAVAIDALTLHSLFSYAAGIPATLTFRGALNNAELNVALQATPFSAPRYAKGHIELQHLGLAGFARALPSTVAELEGQLGIDIDLTAQQSDTGDFKLGIAGATRLAKFALQLQEQRLKVSHDSLAWQGKLDLARQAAQLQWQVEGDIEGRNSSLLQTINEKQVPLLRVASSAVNGLTISQQQVLVIDSVELDSLQLQVIKAKDGKLQLPEANTTQEASAEALPAVTQTAPSQAQSTQAPIEEPAATAASINLRRLKIGGDSGLLFKDDSVMPPFKLKLQLQELQLEQVDNSRPNQPSDFSMMAKLDEYSTMALQGQLYPFKDKLSLELTGNIKSLDLPPLSSYTVPVLGYNLASGHLDADLDLKVDQGVIKSENTLKLNQLKLEPSDPDKAAQFSKRLTMPLDAALSLLRDKDDNIQLKLPVTGDLQNPSFSIADAINQSLSTAMKFAAMSYIKLALQPFGTLVSVFQMADSAGKMVSSVRLDPVHFPLAESGLDGEMVAYLTNTTKLLQSRPKINLKICGRATRADLAAWLKRQGKTIAGQTQPANGDKEEASPLSAQDTAWLHKLARERSAVVKDYLVTTGGVTAARLFICHPQIDEEKGATARVELTL